MGSVIYFCECGTWDPDAQQWLRPNYTGTSLEVTPFQSIPKAFWYAIVTLTTVGYGDFYPTSDAGRIFGAVLIVMGVITLAMPLAVIGNSYTAEYAKMQATVSEHIAAEEAEHQRELATERAAWALANPLLAEEADRLEAAEKAAVTAAAAAAAVAAGKTVAAAAAASAESAAAAAAAAMAPLDQRLQRMEAAQARVEAQLAALLAQLERAAAAQQQAAAAAAAAAVAAAAAATEATRKAAAKSEAAAAEGGGAIAAATAGEAAAGAASAGGPASATRTE